MRLTILLAALLLLPPPQASADEPVERPWLVGVGVGWAAGLSGWRDRSYSSADSYDEVEHSVLGGFRADVTLGYRVTRHIAPYLRLGFGGGAFSYDAPLHGPDNGFNALTRPDKQSVYGHFHAGFGIRLETHPIERLTVYTTFGMLITQPFDETFTFRDETDSEQDHVVSYTAGVGAFGGLGIEWALSEAVALRLDFTADVTHTRWTTRVRKQGVGNYFPIGPDTFTGTVDYQTGDFPDGEPGEDGFHIRRHPASDGGVNGFIGSLALTFAVVFRF